MATLLNDASLEGVSEFLQARKDEGASESSLRSYESNLRMVRSRAGGKSLLALTEAEARELKRRLVELPSAYVLGGTLRMFYKFHGRPDLVQIFRIKKPKKRIAPSDLLTVDEINRMIQAADNLRDRTLIAVLAESGARVHEVLSLNLGDVTEVQSNGERFFRVFFRKVKVPGEEHSAMLVEAAPYLAKWLENYPYPKSKDAPLFPSAEHRCAGERLSVAGARVLVRSIARKAGIPKRVHPHIFRHSRATRLLRMGVPEAQVKRALGWTPGSVMLARYSHLTTADTDNAVLVALGKKPAENVVERMIDVSQEPVRAIPEDGWRVSKDALREEIRHQVALEMAEQLAEQIREAMKQMGIAGGAFVVTSPEAIEKLEKTEFPPGIKKSIMKYEDSPKKSEK